MSVQAVHPGLKGAETGGRQGWAPRLGLLALSLIGGLAVFVFGYGFYDFLPTNNNPLYLAILSGIFLALALWLRRDQRGEKYWRAAYAFFTASAALLLSTLMARYTDVLLDALQLTTGTSQGMAVAKSFEMLVVVASILLLTQLSGADLGSIFLQRGNLKLGLGVGALVLINLGTAALLFLTPRFSSMGTFGAAIAWGLVFSCANSFMEELLLRGIFLKRFTPLLGAGSAVLVTSIVFSLMHAGAVYLTPFAVPFLVVNTLTLGLACGYLMMKADGIWGAVLIHAAADLFLFVALLANA